MTPLRGWGPKGRRLVAKAPHGHWKTMTFIAALRCDRIDAPLVIEGPINGESFAAYVEQVLVPTLKEADIVVLDNLGSHRGAGVRSMIRAAGARVFSCRPIAPISTRSSKSSRSSNIKCATPQSGPSKTPGGASARSSKRSRQTSAQTTSETQAMLPYECSTL
jgi:hypothetical protein